VFVHHSYGNAVIASRAAKVVLFSVLYVCVFVLLSVNTITFKPLGHLQGIMLWSKWRKVRKWHCVVRLWWANM